MRIVLISYLLALFVGLLFGFKVAMIGILIFGAFYIMKSYIGVAIVVSIVLVSSLDKTIAKDKGSEDKQSKIHDIPSDDIQLKMIKETYFKITDYERIEKDIKGKGHK